MSFNTYIISMESDGAEGGHREERVEKGVRIEL